MTEDRSRIFPQFTTNKVYSTTSYDYGNDKKVFWYKESYTYYENINTVDLRVWVFVGDSFERLILIMHDAVE